MTAIRQDDSAMGSGPSHASVGFRRVWPGSEDYGYMADLYGFSFPPAEREGMDVMMRVSGTGFGRLSVALDGDKRIGLLYVLECRDLVYIYYLAVDPGLQGRGYGSEILRKVREDHPGCRLALSCEAPDDAAENNGQRLERISFYERNGFRDTGMRAEWRGVTYVHLACGGHVGRSESDWMFNRHRELGESP